jgi:TorA maturation chaperone TorD
MSGPASTPTASDHSEGDSTPLLPEPTEAEVALCRSALWEALALGLRPPTDDTVARLVSPTGAAALADAAAILDTVRDTALAPAVRRLAQPVALDGLGLAYARLFGHTARGPVPPYETEYGADSVFQPMHEMSDLVAFYRAFGLQLRPTAHERPDHVSCESEFLAFLARKEAWALAHADTAMYEATYAAERRFLGDHLGRWGLAFARLLERHDPGGFYGALGALGAELIAAECARVGVAAGPELCRLRAASPPEPPAACAAATDGEGPEGASAMGRLGMAGPTWLP